jgi:hypothetical protein
MCICFAGFAPEAELILILEGTYRKGNNAESVRQFQPRRGSPCGQPARGALKELRRRLLTARPCNPFRGRKQSPRPFLNPGFQSKPWADIGQRFQRYSTPNASDSAAVEVSGFPSLIY